jgi:CspA family cold shock protein
MSVSGTLKFFNQQKGFGFICRDDGEQDVFVHITAVLESGFNPGLLDKSGVKMEFELRKGRKGPEVLYINKIGDARPTNPTRSVESPPALGNDIVFVQIVQLYALIYVDKTNCPFGRAGA